MNRIGSLDSMITGKITTKRVKILLITDAISVLLLLLTFKIYGFETVYNHIVSVKIAYSFLVISCIIAPIFIISRFFNVGKYRRKHIISTSFFVIMIVVGIITSLTFFSISTFPPLISEGDKGPILLVTDQSGIYNVNDRAICFWTEKPTINRVEWGEINGTTHSFIEPMPSNEHCIMLTDLHPDTTYWYSINGYENHTFKTPKLSDSLSFTFAGDFHIGSSKNNKSAAIHMLDGILNSNTDFFVGLGDFVDGGFLDSQWKEFFDAASPYLSNISTIPVIGNHDAMFNGYTLYRRYFYPNGIHSNSSNPYYRHIAVSNVHIFVLRLEWGVETIPEGEISWLKKELSSVPHDEWKIVVMHAPMYASCGDRYSYTKTDGFMDNINVLEPIMKAYRVNMVISGHTHRMEALEKDGVFYIVAGSFGSLKWEHKPYEPSRYSLWMKDKTLGYVKATIDGDEANIQFVSLNSTVLYTHTIELNDFVF